MRLVHYGYGAIGKTFTILNPTGFKHALSKIKKGESGVYPFCLINELDGEEIFRELKFIKTSAVTAEGNWDERYRFFIRIFNSNRAKLTIE